MTQDKRTIEIDLTEVKFFDLNERPVKFGDLNDHIGNTIFLNARTVPMSEAGASIHKTGKASVGIQDLIMIIATVESDQQTTLLLKNGVCAYLRIKLAEFAESKTELAESIDHSDKVKDGIME